MRDQLRFLLLLGLAHRLGLAILCHASLGQRFAISQRSGSKRTGGLCAPSPLVAEQIIAVYLRLTGLVRIATGGVSIVDPWLAQIVNPESF